jgi:hypothetical protein
MIKTSGEILDMLIKYQLQIDFYTQTIKTPDNDDWYWAGDDFISTLNKVVHFIETGEE